MVSDHRYAELSQWRWAAVERHGVFYAQRCTTRTKRLYMHRFILELTNPRTLSDHRDGNGLNNQDHNLRIATPAQNNRNSRMMSNNTSGVRGVSWDKRRQDWHAYVNVNGRRKHLGHFTNLADAKQARVVAELKYHGNFSALLSRGENVPLDSTTTNPTQEQTL